MANKLVEIKADMFIIPNKANRIQSFYWFQYIDEKDYAKKHLDFYKNLYADNGKEFDLDEKLVQIWITNDVSDNIIRHGYVCSIDGQRYYIDNSDLSSLEDCPKPLIDIKESESTDILVKNIPAYDKDHENPTTVDILFHLTANQHEYRYRNFGTFEETLERVLY